MSVNVTGVHNVIRAYLPLMQSGQVKKVINMSVCIILMLLEHVLTLNSARVHSDPLREPRR